LDVEKLEIFDCDDNFEEITGYVREEILKKPLSLRWILPQEEYRILPSKVRKLKEAGESSCCFHTRIRSPKSAYPVSVETAFVFEAYIHGGRKVLDIKVNDGSYTQMKEYTENPQHRELMFLVDNIMKTFGGSFINFCPDTGDILFVNESCLEFFGYDLEAFMSVTQGKFKNLILEERKRVMNILEEQIEYSVLLTLPFLQEIL
jgi:PAS domain-containing protein